MRMRYFYTCPLKSAYMAKYFGIRFEPIETEFNKIEQFNKIEHWTSLMAELEDCHCIEEDRAREKYHMCHDSLAILEPMQWDLVEHEGINYGIVLDVIDSEAGIQYITNEAGETIVGMVNVKELTIIQRNNTAFFWPETTLED